MEGRRGEGVSEVSEDQRNVEQVQEYSLQQMRLSMEEIQVLKECNRESFWYRCVPFSLIFMGGTQMMVNKGIFKPNPRFGALFKHLGAVFVGYIAGKASYHGKCKQKILQLQNSQLADAIRNKGRTRALWSDADNQPEYTGPLSSSRKSELNVDVDYDANRVVDRHDENYRPSVDADAPLPTILPESTVDARTSYDELRQRNRAEHEKKRQESPSRPHQAIPPAPTPPTAVPPKPREKRNKYGDIIED